MRNSMRKSSISVTELVFFVIGMLLLLALARIVTGQTEAQGVRATNGQAQVQQRQLVDRSDQLFLQCKQRRLLLSCRRWSPFVSFVGIPSQWLILMMTVSKSGSTPQD